MDVRMVRGARAEIHLKPRSSRPSRFRSQVVPQPLGVVFAIMPWSFPYWQVVRALAPALAAGNVILLKHAPSTTGCGLALADVAASAGLPSACCPCWW